MMFWLLSLTGCLFFPCGGQGQCPEIVRIQPGSFTGVAYDDPEPDIGLEIDADDVVILTFEDEDGNAWVARYRLNPMGIPE
ncbi:MAG: hypothetical protein AAGA48_00465 [Myxococcota bacterium]